MADSGEDQLKILNSLGLSSPSLQKEGGGSPTVTKEKEEMPQVSMLLIQFSTLVVRFQP